MISKSFIKILKERMLWLIGSIKNLPYDN